MASSISVTVVVSGEAEAGGFVTGLVMVAAVVAEPASGVVVVEAIDIFYSELGLALRSLGSWSGKTNWREECYRSSSLSCPVKWSSSSKFRYVLSDLLYPAVALWPGWSCQERKTGYPNTGSDREGFSDRS